MKTTTLFALSLLLVTSLPSFALDYTITFSASGASNTIGNVIVQNLTKGTTITVPAGNVLNLTDKPTAVVQVSANSEFIRIYPSSVKGKSTVSFFSKQPGNTQINAFSIDGRKIAGINTNLETGSNTFELSMPKGIFVIQVIGNEYSYTAKMVNQSATKDNQEITYISTEKLATYSPHKSKSSALGVTAMTYTSGDRLLYKAVSGTYSALVNDVPTFSKTTNFEFVACKDADGNNYTTVKIGNQTWMAENLKTTHYRNNVLIDNVTVYTTWAGLTASAWCDNYNTTANGTMYGHLYNWYAVVDSRNISPVGWHVPIDAEWTTLENYLIVNGYNYDGTTTGNRDTNNKIAKALATTANWSTYSTTGTVGSNLTLNNSTGFSAFPGGYRGFDGSFNYPGSSGCWWSATEFSTSDVWFRRLDNFYDYVSRQRGLKVDGFSVRCLMD
jgi:uncharacterized protein (TIGR02145 family)